MTMTMIITITMTMLLMLLMVSSTTSTKGPAAVPTRRPTKRPDARPTKRPDARPTPTTEPTALVTPSNYLRGTLMPTMAPISNQSGLNITLLVYCTQGYIQMAPYKTDPSKKVNCSGSNGTSIQLRVDPATEVADFIGEVFVQGELSFSVNNEFIYTYSSIYTDTYNMYQIVTTSNTVSYLSYMADLFTVPTIDKVTQLSQIVNKATLCTVERCSMTLFLRVQKDPNFSLRSIIRYLSQIPVVILQSLH